MNPDSQPAPPPRRKFLPHGTPPWVEANSIFFVTVCCTPRGENQLCHRHAADVIFETVAFRQSRGDWFVHLFVLMPDHLHGLISFPRDVAMRRIISNWKEIVAKKTSVCWQRDFFDHRLRGDEGYEEKAHYIRMNPVRAGLTSDRAAWSYVWEPDST
jgi:REP element-mobilizing transposase RayT